MRVSTLVRSSTRWALAGLLLGACADSPVAPPATKSPAKLPSSVEVAGLSFNARPFNGTAIFTVMPGQAIKASMGFHWIYFPADAICDPLTSQYGPEHWDTPCEPLKVPLTIEARYTIDDGLPAIKFFPDVRFVPAPADRADRWVVMSLKSPTTLSDLTRYAITWIPTGANYEVDEGRTDPTLRAWRGTGNTLVRRMKHLSGYNVSAGITEEEGERPPTGGEGEW